MGLRKSQIGLICILDGRLNCRKNEGGFLAALRIFQYPLFILAFCVLAIIFSDFIFFSLALASLIVLAIFFFSTSLLIISSFSTPHYFHLIQMATS